MPSKKLNAVAKRMYGKDVSGQQSLEGMGEKTEKLSRKPASEKRSKDLDFTENEGLTSTIYDLRKKSR